MPPKAKVTREMILDAAFDLVRSEGQGALNVRALARCLGCSTQPILYNFATMEALTAAVYERADEERHLFRFLFESNRFGGMDLRGLMQGPGIGELVDILSQGLCCERAEAERVFLAFFAVVHGLGSLLCNNAMAYDETQCTEMLETVFYGALASLKGDNHA